MAVVQSKSSAWTGGGGAITVTLDSTPGSTNTLIAFVTTEGGGATIDTAGWSNLQDLNHHDLNRLQMWTAVGSAGSAVHLPTNGVGGSNRYVVVYEVDDDIETHDGVINGNFSGSGVGTISGPTLVQAEEAGVILAAFTGENQTYVGTAVFTAVSPLVALAAASKSGSARVHQWAGAGTTTAGSYTPEVTVTGLTSAKPTAVVAVILSHDVPATPVADFDYTPNSGVAPLSVEFTDTSTGTPTSWAWDFGDGDTSTSQNPTHVYDEPGTYTVTLTATNAFGSDDESKTAIISVLSVLFEPPLPALALVEIYAAEAGAARWDYVNWDEAVWSSSAWQDVTPQSVEAVITWGSTRPEMGILSKPNAGAWAITTYDPTRILDPANEEGPYFADLEPNMPVRITHRGIVIKQGLAESIEFEYATGIGRLRVYDNIALMANAQVPPDTMLSDTLYARAVDAIAAAGLSVQVLTVPPSGDPAVYAWTTGVNEWSVWQWITDAAEQTMHVAYIDNVGRLGFRAWASPLARGRTLDATNLIGLASLTQWNGLYSVVRAYDGATMQERALTPPPRYGARIYERSDATIDAETWAEAVLADRAFSALRWVPGELYPLTADDVEHFATIEAVELVGLSHGYTDPEVLANLIIVGGEIRLTAKKEEEAKWWFTYEAAQTPLVPLSTEDETGFLTDEDSLGYLYPDV